MSSREVTFVVVGDNVPHGAVSFGELGKPGNEDIHTALGWRRKYAPGAKIKLVIVEKGK